jgi:hypothetical protein
MTQAPQQEVEVQAEVGQAVALPVGNDGATAYRWTLELPDGVEAAGSTPPEAPGSEASSGTGSRLLVRSDRPGSHVLTATLAESPTSTPMTILLIRLTVS